ncbi:hypothetical protein EDD68_1186 [Melghiribacillus thermohalophilus]|uniref:Uncharacterized protein n=1 Tax=Melghiribacillus thermohalophilus TaxID=1324956 RepID=A0A4R3MX62_9BACI|nr:hypothetical protein EDD68_1186 [Melghiribacillus thermohalophilus]
MGWLNLGSLVPGFIACILPVISLLFYKDREPETLTIDCFEHKCLRYFIIFSGFIWIISGKNGGLVSSYGHKKCCGNLPAAFFSPLPSS